MREGKYCLDCGRQRDAHHEFTTMYLPDECICEAGDWGAVSVPVPCSTFAAMSGAESELCATCEHEIGCHKPAPAASEKE
jgi:hypothetical protein